MTTTTQAQPPARPPVSPFHASGSPAPALIRARFGEARTSMRHRDAARAIGVSEAQTVAAFVGTRAIKLKPPFSAILERCGVLGEVMAITRNEAAVHERMGEYRNLSHDGPVGLAVGEDIDLRIFYMHWASAFALTEDSPHGPVRSLQFFDRQGDAVHKIYLKACSSLEGWMALVDDFRAELQDESLAVEPAPAPSLPRPDADVDVAGLQAAWEAMRDTHEFFGMLGRFGVTRTQGLRLAPPGRARPLPLDAVRRMLCAAAQRDVPIMVFVGNRGMIQIHTGPVQRIEPLDTDSARWINVLDPKFNLHLDEARVAQAWRVSKPTADGDVTSIEVFDAVGDNIAMCFGKRKPGEPERADWCALLADVFGAC